MLNNLKFTCDKEGCPHSQGFGLSYGDAVHHLSRCKFKKTECELGCGAKLLSSEVESHALVCKLKTEFCSECETLFYPNNGSKMEGHDCMEELLKRYNNGKDALNSHK